MFIYSIQGLAFDIEMILQRSFLLSYRIRLARNEGVWVLWEVNRVNHVKERSQDTSFGEPPVWVGIYIYISIKEKKGFVVLP